MNLQVNGVEAEDGTVNSPGHPGARVSRLPCLYSSHYDRANHFRHVPAVSPPVPLHQLVFPPPLLGPGMESSMSPRLSIRFTIELYVTADADPSSSVLEGMSLWNVNSG